ncbi:MAG: hypothetical protein A2Y10_13060 [Planctomycetes bacterium GWF2_41_51]|nr:MAG: hypothetical protein A2Y10_13060 [Planctomycetes bacterium GWF2_41_51]HBG60714.1 hypothetical protein [Candidatus Omnitrophota bacterium]
MDNRLLFKISLLISQKLTSLEKNTSIELLERLTKLAEHFRDMTQESRRIALALNRNWLFSAKRCRENLVRILDEIPYKIETIKQISNKDDQEGTPIVSLIFAELTQIRQEFSDADFNSDKRIISVVTKPVTLEDIYLGPFRIELYIDKLSSLYKESPYYCIALEPNPAANNGEVTHPHVSGETLCEGEGYVAIRAALEQGRMYDFFTIVNNILNTYSPDSPYVALDDWFGGADCYDCGSSISEDDSYYCGFCGRVFCSECSSYCRSCEESCCLGCGGHCPNCEEFICKNCLKVCQECGERYCNLCMEDSICETCKEQNETEELENTNETDGKQDNFKMAG